MNRYVERIKQIDAQIAWLDRALDHGEHLAAGLTLTLNVGPALDGADDGVYRDGTPKEVTLEVSLNTEHILCLIRHSLGKSRHHDLTWARKELTELAELIETHTKETT